MHSSLTVKTNIALAAVWLAIAVTVVLLSRQSQWAPVGYGLALGIIAGALQLRAIRDSADTLVRATTAADVRRGLRSSAAGRVYTYFLWFGSFSIIFFAGFWHARSGGAPAGMISGAAAFAFVRELISLPGVARLKDIRLERAASINVV